MKILDVYNKFKLTPTKSSDCHLWDGKGKKYLDLYGGHGVISIGHSHPEWVEDLQSQLTTMAYYSNAVEIPLQQEYAQKLAAVSGVDNYQLFLCNSGAEANENALKIASVTTGRKKIIAFKGAFHGRTNGALAATDNPKIQSPLSGELTVEFLPLNDTDALKNALDEKVAAIIIEPIQGVGGVAMPSDEFLEVVSLECEKAGTLLILDEIQSGCGRSGKYFAHQWSGIKPDMITMAKGIGNGFPLAGVLVRKGIAIAKGMLGTTYGGSYLACTAGISVANVMEDEGLLNNAEKVGKYAKNKLEGLAKIRKVLGRGLMIGMEFDFPVKELQNFLINEKRIVTGGSSNPNVLRIIPPLTISTKEIDALFEAISEYLNK